MSYTPQSWAYADHISDRIIDLINEELKTDAYAAAGPVQLLAGQMLAMLGMLQTARGLDAPPEMIRVWEAMRDCLNSMNPPDDPRDG